MAARGITLRWFTSHYKLSDVNIIDGVRVRIEVACATGMATKIFAYRMLPLSPRTGENVGHFSHVCAPPDIAEFPEDAPLVGYAPEWFRLSYVDVLIRSMEEAEDFINIVRQDVRSLKRTLDRMDIIVPEGTEVVGAACITESADSESASLSLSASDSASIGASQMLCRVGTTEQAVGFGAAWQEVGEGAGTPIGVSDSAGANYQRARLIGSKTASQLLVVQGFDFSELPDDAIVDGIAASLVIRDATHLLQSQSSEVASEASSEALLPCTRLCYATLQHPYLGLGQNKASQPCLTGPAWDTINMGGPFDTWGYRNLYGRDLKQGSFGLGIVVGNDEDIDEAIIDVDGVEICVYYRLVY